MFTSANSISMPSSLANCPRASVAERAVSVSHPSSSSIEAISSRVRGSSSATKARRGIGTTGMAGSTSYLPLTPMRDSRLSSWMDDVIFLPRRSRPCALASELTLSKRLPAPFAALGESQEPESPGRYARGSAASRRAFSGTAEQSGNSSRTSISRMSRGDAANLNAV
jgi:hypothetical protein